MGLRVSDRYRTIWLSGNAGSAALAPALALRAQAFRGRADADDEDPFDHAAHHLLIEETETGAIVACARVTDFTSGREIAASYCAQHYDLAGLARLDAPSMEIGRLCAHPDLRDPDPLRLAWMRLAGRAATRKAAMLFGCSSFRGADPNVYAEAFALLARFHLAPRRWRPRVKAPRTIPFASVLRPHRPEGTTALRVMPPLLRTYLSLGGRVSDHAVVDADLGTMHVFTGLELGATRGDRRVLAGHCDPHGPQDDQPAAARSRRTTRR